MFVVATANDVTVLPPEMLRKGRFDVIFFVDLPDEADREAILSIHLSSRKRTPTPALLTQELMALTAGFSGAELEQVVIDGLFSAFAEGKVALTAKHLQRAAEHTVPLATTMETQITALRQWAVGRAMMASTVREIPSGKSAKRSILG